MKKRGAQTGKYSITGYGKSGLIIAVLIGSITLASITIVSAENVQIDDVKSNSMKQSEQGMALSGNGATITEKSEQNSGESELLNFAFNNQEIFSSIGVICLALVFKVGLRFTESRTEQKWRSPEIDWLNYE